MIMVRTNVMKNVLKTTYVVTMISMFLYVRLPNLGLRDELKKGKLIKIMVVRCLGQVHHQLVFWNGMDNTRVEQHRLRVSKNQFFFLVVIVCLPFPCFLVFVCVCRNS